MAVFCPQLKYIRSVNVSEGRKTTQICQKKKKKFTEQRVKLRVRVGYNKPRVTFTEQTLKDSAWMMSLPGRP